jgi:hypothetical protein
MRDQNLCKIKLNSHFVLIKTIISTLSKLKIISLLAPCVLTSKGAEKLLVVQLSKIDICSLVTLHAF